jgi:hypothetical protein
VRTRLLVIGVDAAEGTTVTFDSYETEQGKRETEYGDAYLGKSVTIKYNEGIGISHLFASSTMPEVYAYEDIEGRKFWDGGLLSNTPVNELLEAHKKFWVRRIGSNNLENSFRMKVKTNGENVTEYSLSEKDKDIQKQGNNFQRIPDLEMYMVNLLDPKQNNTGNAINSIVPEDFDGVRDRHIDIKLGDGYDIKTNLLYSDYVNLIENLIGLEDDDEIIKKKIEKILDDYTPRRFITEEFKKNIDILKNTFQIVKKVKIQRKDDENSISGKLADFTIETINKLIRDGYEDTLSK